MIHLTVDVQTLGISKPQFELFQKVRVYAEYEGEEAFEAEGIVCGLLFEHSARYPTSQFFRDGWWYDIGFTNLLNNPDLPCMHREWCYEAELYPLS
jgi:hypothetical protein